MISIKLYRDDNEWIRFELGNTSKLVEVQTGENGILFDKDDFMLLREICKYYEALLYDINEEEW